MKESPEVNRLCKVLLVAVPTAACSWISFPNSEHPEVLGEPSSGEDIPFIRADKRDPHY